MARVNQIQTNFTAGEISEKCFGRVDVSRYQNGAESLENCIVHIHGGAERRPGTLFVAETKDSSKKSRLIPFVFSTTQAYMLEFGHQYMRVYNDGGVVMDSIIEFIANGNFDTSLAGWTVVQGSAVWEAGSAKLITVAGQAGRITKLLTDLIVGQTYTCKFTLSGNGSYRVGTTPGGSELVNATVSGTSTVTFVATQTSHYFSISNIGGTSPGGDVLADNISVTGRTSAVSRMIQPYEITTPYTEDMLADLDYTQGADTMFNFQKSVITHTLKRLASDSWAHQPAPFTVMPFDEIGHTFSATLTLSDATVGTGRTATAGASTFLAGDVGRRITYLSGIATITGFTSATVVTVTVDASFPVTSIPADAWRLEDSPQVSLTASAKDPVGASVTLTCTGTDAFRSGDVGKYVRINSGLVKLTGFTSAQSVSGKIERVLSSTVAAPAVAWSLEAAVWNAVDGYPSTGCLYEQRLIAAGSSKYPQTIWGSKSGLYFDFMLGTNDDEAFSFTLPTTGQINPIQRMATSASLIPLTYGGEFTIEGGIEKPLTPTNVRSRQRSNRGIRGIKPVQIDGETIIVQRSGRKVRALSYDVESGKYAIPNLNTLAEHITESGIVDMAYQQEPGSRLHCVRADGKMAVLAIDRDEGVTAWTPFSTDGEFESVACIPNVSGDEVWAIVKRTIDGETKRYVERFDSSVLTDCAIKGTSEEGSAVWAGLDHLEGKIVDVKADGSHMGRYTVTGGEITLTRIAYEVEIGLPYSNRVKLLRPEVVDGQGTAQASNIRSHEVALLFTDTIGAKVNGDMMAFRQFGSELLDQPPQTYSGFKSIGTTGWMKGKSEIEIVQDEPYPFHLLAVVRKFTSNS